MTSRNGSSSSFEGTGLLVGYGSIGRRHLGNLHRLGVEDWAVVHTGTGTLPLEPPCPVRRYSSLEEALAQETPRFAVVANPTALHAPTTLRCVEAGCDVLLEKPVSHEVGSLDRLVEAVSTRDVEVLVGFQFRFDGGLRRLARLLGEGVIGEPLHVRAVWGEYLPSWHPWEDWRQGYAARRDLGGGVHLTLCHPFDYLRMLFGEPTLLSASLQQHGPLGLEVAEAADVTLRYAGGPTVQVHLDYWARPSTHRVEVVGADGTLRWDHRAGTIDMWRGTDPGWCTEQVPGAEARDELFVRETSHFLDVVARSASPICTLADGIAATRLCVAIDAAARQAQPLMAQSHTEGA